MNNGIPAGTAVNSIIQDKQGFLWFNVLGGVAKYDGYNLNIYNKFYSKLDTLFFPESISLFIDKNGDLWVGSDNTISMYDIQMDRFNSFYLIENEDKETDLPLVKAICEGSDEILWLATYNHGMFSFNKKSKLIKRYTHEKNSPNTLPGISLSGIVADKKGNIWISTYSNGLCKLDVSSNKFTIYSENSSNHNLLTDSVSSIYSDKEGKIWITLGGDYISEIDPISGAIQNYEIKGDGIKKCFKFFISEDSDGIYWIGCNREGIILFDKKNNRFNKIVDRNFEGKNQSIVNSLSFYQDRSNVIWVGSREVINKFSKDKQRFYSYNESPEYQNAVGNAVVYTIASDLEGNIWFGTTNGIYKHSSLTGEYIHYLKDKSPERDPKNFGKNTIWGMCFDESGTLWAATVGGFCKFDTVESNIIYYNHDPNDSNSISEGNPGFVFLDSKGDLWISLDKKLDKFDRKNNFFKHYDLQTIRSVYEDENRVLWACSGSKGLYKYDQNRDEFTEYFEEGSFIGFSMALEDKQKRFWVSSFFSGLNEFNRTTERHISYGTSTGLPSDFVNNIVLDNNDMIWASTRVGLSRFDPSNKTFKNFNESDGLQFIDFQTTSSYKDKNGKLYFGGRNGIVSFYPAAINGIIPLVVITKLSILNDTSNSELSGTILEKMISDEEVNLNYSNNSFNIEFASLDFRSPDRNQYSYMLEGFDKDWSIPGTGRIASYKNISEGEYTFKVKGSNDDGVWNETGASLKLYIAPPWWRTWWFTSLWVILVLALFGGTIRFVSTQKLKRKLRELKYQQELEAERLRISKDMHDEVGSNLTKISLLSEIAKKKLGGIEEIEKISDASKEVVTNMDEIVWAVNPGNDKLENLIAYISKYAEEFLEGTNINNRFAFPQNIPDIQLPSDIRHNIFLTIKEALNNAVKHSCAKTITVGLKMSQNEYTLFVKDDGKGFDLNVKDRFSNGLNNMKKRINNIGGEFSILSNAGSGTEITLTIKLNK